MTPCTSNSRLLFRQIIAPTYYPTLDSALSSVREGRHWGVLHFMRNFTDSLYARLFAMVEMKVPDESTLDRSEVHVYLDMTNQQVGYTIQLRMAEAYQEFSKVRGGRGRGGEGRGGEGRGAELRYICK